VITQALELLDRCDQATYEELAKELILPSHRHIRKSKSNLFSEGISGFRKKITSWMNEACCINNGWLDKETREVLITFDGCIMHGSFLLSNKKGEENCIIGCNIPSLDGITERLFKAFVQRMKREVEGTKSIAKTKKPLRPLLQRPCQKTENISSFMPSRSNQVENYVSSVRHTIYLRSRESMFGSIYESLF
jgi:hypothetical protein